MVDVPGLRQQLLESLSGAAGLNATGGAVPDGEKHERNGATVLSRWKLGRGNDGRVRADGSVRSFVP